MRKYILLQFTLLLFAGALMAQPANDDCANAVTLTPSPNSTCNNTAGTNVGVVSTDYDGCAEISKRNVWYKFVASSGTHIVQVTFGTMQQGIINVFANGCGSLTHLTCGGFGQSGPVIQRILSGLTVGQEYLVAVSTREQSEEGSFDICITTPQPPANDECSAAVSLTVNPSNLPATRTNSTSLFANQSLPACTGTADDDVWFSFIATQTNHRVHLFYSSSFFTLEAFSGSCGTLASIHCSSPGGTNKTALLSGLTVGQTYFIRVYSNSSGASSQGSFQIAITSAPQNDECTSSIPITPSAAGDDNCTNSVAGATFDATQSSVDCFGGNSTSNDTWFNFVATQSVHTIKVHGFGNNVIRYQVMSGNCGSLNSLFCGFGFFSGDTAMQTVGGLTTGQTYFIRIYSGNSGGIEGTFNACVTSPVFPSNDECINAAILTPASDSTINYTNATTVGATSNTITGSCNDGGRDVWYSFTATATQHVIKTINVTNVNSLQMELWFGNCGSLVHQRCSVANDSLFGIGNLTIGQTYYIRVYNNSPFFGDDFQIAIFTPQALANDECSNAITIVPAADASCNEVSGTTLGATQSSRDNICSGNTLIGPVGDVWYRFNATSTSHRVRLIKGTGRLGFQVFSGNCGSLVSLGCSGLLTGVEGSGTELRFDGLIIGNSYFIRVLNTAPETRGTFDLCVKTVVVPANNECVAATTLTPQSSITFGTFTTGNSIDATASAQATSCSTGQDDDVWFKFTATQSNMQVYLQNSSITTTRIAVYSGTCGGVLTLVKCQLGNTRDNVVALTGLVAGTEYLVRVYSSSTAAGSQGVFSIMVTTQFNPPVNDDCINATELFPAANNTCTPVRGTTIDAAASGNATCVNGNEVWYRFIATATSHRVNVEGFVNTPVVTVFSGSCAGLTLVPSTCASGSMQVSTTANSLVVGNTYFVKVLSSTTAAFTQSIFDICITTPQAPTNDDCANPVSLTVDPDATSDPAQLFSTNLATFTGAPTCTFFGNDVWFSFVAPAEPVSVEVNGLNANPAIEIVEGTCGALTSLQCNGNSASTLTNVVNTNGLVAGNTYLIRVSNITFSTPMDFRIKVYKNLSGKINSSIDSVCLTNNLVQNPSLENDLFLTTSFIGAADPGSEFIYNWRLPTRGTADFFNARNSIGSAVDIPYNICFGRQSARNGNGYAGFFAYTSSSTSYREYLENEMSAPMIVGQRYLVSMYVSLAEFSTIAVDNLSIALRTSQTREVSSAPLPFTAQVISPDNVFITDKKGWVNISAIITADQPYRYLVIGNFKNNALTDTLRLVDTSAALSGGSFAGCASPQHTSYYFVDDVMVSPINGNIAGCGTAVLPLHLLSFTGHRVNKEVQLDWKTVNEQNTSRFEIQRSANGIDFLPIGSVVARNSAGDHTYGFVDRLPVAGANYYRLKMIDTDGRFTYSSIVRIVMKEEKQLRVYPNPASEMIQVQTAMPYHTVEITDMAGRKYMSWTKSLNGQYPVSALAKGIYMVRIIGAEGVATEKLVKQ